MADPKNAARPISRRLRWALGLSLALNLIFVGFVLGAAYRFRDGPPGAVPHAGRFAEAYVRALPRPDRRDLRRALRGALRGEAGLVQRKRLFAEVMDTLRQPQLDEARLKQLIDRQSQLSRRVERVVLQGWFDRISAMSPEERIAYADRVEALLRRGPRGAKRGQGD